MTTTATAVTADMTATIGTVATRMTVTTTMTVGATNLAYTTEKGPLLIRSGPFSVYGTTSGAVAFILSRRW
ncbi:hypothetical protein [Hymenobacter sp. GOD-10R]|uniref:hypothetical protein n=1 Tax=Hymenobacter sp. GOD-10R TaxID=3093922 RepID=UPI002D7979DD|nr:hypothetical protein [Hymenobacter sp. GOD-10R]WRQ29295.1 hypothetical protein SD425_03340 [Hymenobacter sp. GOD-10R]